VNGRLRALLRAPGVANSAFLKLESGMEMDRVGWKGKWWSWKRNKGMEGRERKQATRKGDWNRVG